MAMLVPGDQVCDAIIAMAIAIAVFGVLAMYVSQVVPSEFGVRRPWHFIVTDPIKWLMHKFRGTRAPTSTLVDRTGETTTVRHSACAAVWSDRR